MDMLRILEEKISSLISVVQELKVKNEALKIENEQVKKDVQLVQSQNAKLIEENEQLAAKLEMIGNSVLQGNERMEETKVVVDDLIRSIDALVGNEHQQ